VRAVSVVGRREMSGSISAWPMSVMSAIPARPEPPETGKCRKWVLVRRLIVAGSGPGRVPDLPAQSAEVRQVVGKPVLGDDDFLYLFFPETGEGRRAGLASLRRLHARLSGVHVEVAPAAVAPRTLRSPRSEPACGTGWAS
jgi:hypothetical protein